jgi:hypothetical protein
MVSFSNVKLQRLAEISVKSEDEMPCFMGKLPDAKTC